MQVSFESIQDDYVRNWTSMRIRPSHADSANEAAQKAVRNKEIYKQIEGRTDVPWWFVAILHSRESSFNFNTYLGNGQALNRITTIVPKGRGPFASFADGAVDALGLEGFVGARDWSIARTMFRLEKYNGFGYRGRGVNSPYLWSGSSIYGPPEQRGGKFVGDGQFDPNEVDRQLGAAVILKAMMELDSSITFSDASMALSRLEPEDQTAPMALLMQQTLNKLGANPPLDEDGIVGPKTKAAIVQFQQQHGINESGALDSVTTAAITRAAQQLVASPATTDFSPVLTRLEDLLTLLRTGSIAPTPMPTPKPTPVASDPISLIERLFALVTKTGTLPGAVTQGTPGTAPVDQLKQIVDLLGTFLDKSGKPGLGQVNGALGDTIGNLLNGKKTAIGMIGSILVSLLGAIPKGGAADGLGGIVGALAPLASAIPGAQVTLPIFLALSAWGVLGKMEKWAQGTAPPPKPTN